MTSSCLSNAALLAGLVVGVFACGGPAKPATPGPASDPTTSPAMGPVTGTPDGGGPLDPSLIAPGKGWSCLAPQLAMGGLWCMRTEDECNQKREAAVRLVLKDGGSKEDAEASAGPACAKTTPWCWTGPFGTPDAEKGIHCWPNKEECLGNLEMSHSPDSPPPSGCAEVY